jgi:DNA modification methylase
MYSVKGDTVLDPFLGTGTTMLAAIASERNSIGVEIDSSLSEEINHNIISSKDILNNRITQRINEHLNFLTNHNSDIKYFNENHQFKVKTNQEKT